MKLKDFGMMAGVVVMSAFAPSHAFAQSAERVFLPGECKVHITRKENLDFGQIHLNPHAIISETECHLRIRRIADAIANGVLLPLPGTPDLHDTERQISL